MILSTVPASSAAKRPGIISRHLVPGQRSVRTSANSACTSAGPPRNTVSLISCEGGWSGNNLNQRHARRAIDDEAHVLLRSEAFHDQYRFSVDRIAQLR